MTRELHPQAEQEFHDAAQWYAEQSIFAAERFIAAIAAALETVTDDPGSFQCLEGILGARMFRF